VVARRCLFMAQSGHPSRAQQCPLSGAKQTSGERAPMPPLGTCTSGRREAGGRLSDAAIKPVPYLVAAPDYSRTVYDRDFLTAPVF
jgi:hypothetical protein